MTASVKGLQKIQLGVLNEFGEMFFAEAYLYNGYAFIKLMIATSNGKLGSDA
jgi:hypothetical protein